jgi:phenylpyruvate tautomerase PptA (4-oxalocrotonate tautomerase family)
MEVQTMPYLQLDVNGHYLPEKKALLARALCETYSKIMNVDISRISVAIRDFGEGSVWRMGDGEPVPASVLTCDIRQGRSAELRMAVAKALSSDCAKILGLRKEKLNVVFTQHAGDEMYHPAFGGWSPEWSSEKDNRS